MLAIGFGLNNTIRFTDNMLPEIEKRADKTRILTLGYNEGWPTVFDFEEDLSGVAWDDEEEGWSEEAGEVSDEGETEDWGDEPESELEGMA